MGTLTANTPRLDTFCEHKLPTSCRLTSIPECCACADERGHSVSYSTYIDGIGFVSRGLRWQRYCWFCKEFWQKRVDVSGLQPAQTKIPEVPDQTAFLERWYEFHRGYRTIRREDGSEEKVAVLGEPWRDVDPGELPRTLEELREGRMRSAMDEVAAAPVAAIEEDAGPSLEETLDRMFEDAEQEEQPRRTQEQRSLDFTSSAPSSQPSNAITNVAGQAMVPAGSRNRDYQARRIAALRRELHRMRNGIERVISGLREFGEDVPNHDETTGRLTDIGRTLDNISGLPSQDDATRAIENVNALTASSGTSQIDRSLANLQSRVDAARQHVNEAQRSRDQAAAELDLAEQERRTSQQRLQQLQREQRTAENYMRLFGTREEMAAAGDAYESPIGGMFTRAEERYRTAEGVRAEQRTLRQVLDDETRAGGEASARLLELAVQNRDVWGVPRARSQQRDHSRWTRRALDATDGVEQLTLHESNSAAADGDDATLEEYYAMLRRQDWTQRPAEQAAPRPDTVLNLTNFPRSMLSDPAQASVRPRVPAPIFRHLPPVRAESPSSETSVESHRTTRQSASITGDAISQRLARSETTTDAGSWPVVEEGTYTDFEGVGNAPREKDLTHWWQMDEDNELVEFFVSERDIQSGEDESRDEFYAKLKREGWTQAEVLLFLNGTGPVECTTFPQYRVAAEGHSQIEPAKAADFYVEAKAVLEAVFRIQQDPAEPAWELGHGRPDLAMAEVDARDVQVTTKHGIEGLTTNHQIVWESRLPTIRLKRLQESGLYLQIEQYEGFPDAKPSSKGWWKLQLCIEFMAQAWNRSEVLRSHASDVLLLGDEQETMMRRLASGERHEDDMAVLLHLLCNANAVSEANRCTQQQTDNDASLHGAPQRTRRNSTSDPLVEDWILVLRHLIQTNDMQKARAIFTDSGIDPDTIDTNTGVYGDGRNLEDLRELMSTVGRDEELVWSAKLPARRLAALTVARGGQLIVCRGQGHRSYAHEGGDWEQRVAMEMMARAVVMSEELCRKCVRSPTHAQRAEAEAAMRIRLGSGERNESDRRAILRLLGRDRDVGIANDCLRKDAKTRGKTLESERARQTRMLSQPGITWIERSSDTSTSSRFDFDHDALLVLDELSRSEDLRARHGFTADSVNFLLTQLRQVSLGEFDDYRADPLAVLHLLRDPEFLWEIGFPSIMALKMARVGKDVVIAPIDNNEAHSIRPTSPEDARTLMWKQMISIDLLAKAFVKSSKVRNESGLDARAKGPLLSRLHAGERSEDDRTTLAGLMRDGDLVKIANFVLSGSDDELRMEHDFWTEQAYLFRPPRTNDTSHPMFEWFMIAEEALRAILRDRDLRVRYAFDAVSLLDLISVLTPRSLVPKLETEASACRLLDFDHLIWDIDLPAFVVRRMRSESHRGLSISDVEDPQPSSPVSPIPPSQPRYVHGISGLAIRTQLMAEAFMSSSEIRLHSGFSQDDSMHLLNGLQSRPRDPGRDRAIQMMQSLLEDQSLVERVDRFLIEHRDFNALVGSEQVTGFQREAAERARRGEYTRQGLNEERQATSALALAASRTAMQSSTRGLLERMANHDDASRAAFQRLQANGLPADLISVDAAGNTIDIVPIEEDEDIDFDDITSEESGDEDLGLDAPGTGRPDAMTDEEMTVKLECRICYAQTASIACLPCGHLVMCQWCSEHHSPCSPRDHTRPMDRNASCPVCRKKIKQKVKVFTATT